MFDVSDVENKGRTKSFRWSFGVMMFSHAYFLFWVNTQVDESYIIIGHTIHILFVILVKGCKYLD